MNRKTIKFLTAGAASLAAALLCAGFANAGAKIGAFADEAAQGDQNETQYTTGGTIESFKLNEKASVRKTEDSGIRFATQISAADKNEIAAVEYGTLVIPKFLLGENELTYENEQAEKIVTQTWANEEETAYYSALTGINEKYYNTPLIARSYMKTAENVVHYTDIAERSLGYVAVMALNAGEESKLIEGIAAATDITLDLNETALKLNSEQTEATLKAKASVGGITYTPEITWGSSAEDVVSVDKNGALQALKEGEATITAKFTLNGEDKSAECKVTVKDEIVLEISGGGDVFLNSTDGQKTRTLNVDKFTVNGKEADKLNITWSATETTYAYWINNKAWASEPIVKTNVTVNNGVVTGVNGGKTTVSAEYSTQFGKATATQEVTVITRVLTSTDADTKAGRSEASAWGKLSLFYTYINQDPFGYYVLRENISFNNDELIYTSDGTTNGVKGGSEKPPANLGAGHMAIPYFYGTLDGRGHTLNNLKIKSNATAYSGNSSYTTGIFGVVTGEIKNMSVEFIDDTPTEYTQYSVRPFIYIMEYGQINNVYFDWQKADYKVTEKTASRYLYTHGVILQARNSAVNNCIVNLSATDNTLPDDLNWFGGVVGRRDFGTMENCYLICAETEKLVGGGTSATKCAAYSDSAAFFAGVSELSKNDGWCEYWKIENGALSFGNNVLISAGNQAE